MPGALSELTLRGRIAREIAQRRPGVEGSDARGTLLLILPGQLQMTFGETGTHLRQQSIDAPVSFQQIPAALEQTQGGCIIARRQGGATLLQPAVADGPFRSSQQVRQIRMRGMESSRLFEHAQCLFGLALPQQRLPPRDQLPGLASVLHRLDNSHRLASERLVRQCGGCLCLCRGEITRAQPLVAAIHVVPIGTIPNPLAIGLAAGHGAVQGQGLVHPLSGGLPLPLLGQGQGVRPDPLGLGDRLEYALSQRLIRRLLRTELHAPLDGSLGPTEVRLCQPVLGLAIEELARLHLDLGQLVAIFLGGLAVVVFFGQPDRRFQFLDRLLVLPLPRQSLPALVRLLLRTARQQCQDHYEGTESTRPRHRARLRQPSSSHLSASSIRNHVHLLPPGFPDRRTAQIVPCCEHSTTVSGNPSPKGCPQ